MKKILLGLLVGFFLISFSSAYYPQDHTYWTLKGFQDIDSPITQKCRPYIEQVLNGDHGTDVPVLHYTDNKITSYIFTHQRSAYLSCIEEAGTDTEAYCFCIGNALHLIQDLYSHGEDGLVVKYLTRYGSSNLLGHMTIERNYEKQHMAIVERTEPQLYSQVMFYDERFLNLLFIETGGDPKYLELLNTMSGIDMTQDARIVRSGYLGEGFYSTIYKDKINLPFWAYGLSLGASIVALIVIIILWLFGKSWWKWVGIGLWVLLLVFGIVIFVSFINGSTWQITTKLIEIPPMFGYLKVSQQDIDTYNQKVQQGVTKFLETGNLQVDDASGLTYIDRNGVKHEGPLNKAEFIFKFVVLPVLVGLFILPTLIAFWIGFVRRKKRK